MDNCPNGGWLWSRTSARWTFLQVMMVITLFLFAMACNLNFLLVNAGQNKTIIYGSIVTQCNFETLTIRPPWKKEAMWHEKKKKSYIWNVKAIIHMGSESYLTYGKWKNSYIWEAKEILHMGSKRNLTHMKSESNLTYGKWKRSYIWEVKAILHMGSESDLTYMGSERNLTYGKRKKSYIWEVKEILHIWKVKAI